MPPTWRKVQDLGQNDTPDVQETGAVYTVGVKVNPTTGAFYVDGTAKLHPADPNSTLLCTLRRDGDKLVGTLTRGKHLFVIAPPKKGTVYFTSITIDGTDYTTAPAELCRREGTPRQTF